VDFLVIKFQRGLLLDCLFACAGQGLARVRDQNHFLIYTAKRGRITVCCFYSAPDLAPVGCKRMLIGRVGAVSFYGLDE
jgi:hypothetical protein